MLLRYVWGVCLLFFFMSAQAQRNVHSINFYYLADGTVQQGSVQVAFELEQAGKALSLPAIVDKDPSNLKLIAKITNLRWNRPDHETRFKLILGQDLNEVSENMQKGVEGNIYFRSTNTFKQMDYSFKGNSTELEPAMVMIGFLVADINATFEEAYNDDGSAGKSVGLGAYVKSFFVAPPYYESAEPDQTEMEADIFITLMESFNDGFVNVSFQMAEYLKNGEYSQFKTQLEEGPSIPAKTSTRKNEVLRSSTAEIKPMVDEETQLFQNAIASNRRSELNNYLNTYPNGRHTSAVRNKIVELTPFELAISQEEDGIYQKFIINIVAGVSSRPPKISVSNNDDWAIQKDIIRADLIHIKVPPERMTEIRLALDSKDTTITLANAEVVAVPSAEPALPANTPGPVETDGVQYDKPDEPYPERKANPLGAIILALPFLGYIYFLLHRKYHLG